jgi:hypothetical protein
VSNNAFGILIEMKTYDEAKAKRKMYNLAIKFTIFLFSLSLVRLFFSTFAIGFYVEKGGIKKRGRKRLNSSLDIDKSLDVSY